MSVKDLRTLVDNLDEYIHVPGGIDRLKKTVLHLAIRGQLVAQDPHEGTGEDLYRQIQVQKQKLITEQKIKNQKPLSKVAENEVPFGIPKSWKWVRIGEAFDVRDGTHDTPKYVDEGYPLVTSKNLSSGILDMTNVKYISETDHSKIMERSGVSRDDILFAMIGSIGNPVIVDTDEEFSIKNVALFKPYASAYYEPKWLLNYLLTATDTMREKSGGGVQSFVSLGFVRGYVIPLPPLAEQKRIVQKTDAIFALIEELAINYTAELAERKKLVISSLASLSRGDSELALAHLTDIIHTQSDAAQLRKAIFRLAISGQLVNQDPREGTGEDLYQKIQTERLKSSVIDKALKKKANLSTATSETLLRIPKTWKWSKLSDFTTMQNGYAFKSSQWIESGLPIVRIQNLNNHLASFNHVDVNDVDKKYIINDGQVLLSWSGTPGTSFGVFIWNRGAAALNQHIFKCDVVGVDKEFFKMAANEAIYNKLSTAHGGVGLKHLTKTQIDMLPIQLPPLAEQERIVAKTFELLALVKLFEDTLKSPSVKSIEAKAQNQLPVAESAHVDTIATISSEELTNQQKKIQRKMLASFIANESLDGAQFGKTKFEKLLHLVEYHVLKKDLNQKYSVQPAGPYDGGFTRLYWNDVIKSKWFKVEGYGNLQKIVAGDKHEKSQKDYGYLSDDEKNKIKGLITLFKKWGYGEAEIISTLYAAWNNRLIKGEEVSDDLLKQDFLQWDPQKTQYTDRLDRALVWMRQNDIVPDGWGNEIKRAKSSTKSV